MKTPRTHPANDAGKCAHNEREKSHPSPSMLVTSISLGSAMLLSFAYQERMRPKVCGSGCNERRLGTLRDFVKASIPATASSGPLTDHGQVINVSCFNSPVARFSRQKIQLISSAARIQSSRRHPDRRCLCTSLPADTGTEAASSSHAVGPGLRTSTQ